MPSSTVLVFSENNPFDTTIYKEDVTSVPLYKVITSQNIQRTSTTVYRCGDDELSEIARLEWKGIDVDMVHFGDYPPQEIGVWLKSSLNPWADGRHFKDDKGRRYKWVNDSNRKALELYAKDTPKKRIVTSTQPTLKAPDERITLTLEPSAAEMQDLVVVSYLFLEKQIRMISLELRNRTEISFVIPNEKLGSKLHYGKRRASEAPFETASTTPLIHQES